MTIDLGGAKDAGFPFSVHKLDEMIDRFLDRDDEARARAVVGRPRAALFRRRSRSRRRELRARLRLRKLPDSENRRRKKCFDESPEKSDLHLTPLSSSERAGREQTGATLSLCPEAEARPRASRTHVSRISPRFTDILPPCSASVRGSGSGSRLGSARSRPALSDERAFYARTAGQSAGARGR